MRHRIPKKEWQNAKGVARTGPVSITEKARALANALLGSLPICDICHVSSLTYNRELIKIDSRVIRVRDIIEN